MTEIQAQPINESPRVDPEDYKVLRPDSYHTDIVSQEELLEKYIRLLNPLVEKLAGNQEQPGFDEVVFLDKSARPLYWMLKKMWPHMAPQSIDEHGQTLTAPMPKVKFANIDRLFWRKNPDQEIEEGGARRITDDDVSGLRAIFNHKENTLDGKRVLIVDEQSESGDTLRVAEKLFKQAFPDADIDGFSWIRHRYTIEKGQKKYEVREIPMWYPPKDEKSKNFKITGRGVFNPIIDKAKHENERFPENSYQFLSTKARLLKTEFSLEEQHELAALRDQLLQAKDEEEERKIESQIEKIMTMGDPESLQLRKEIGQMAVDFARGKLFPAITSERQEILGKPALEYNLYAKAVRQGRQR